MTGQSATPGNLAGMLAWVLTLGALVLSPVGSLAEGTSALSLDVGTQAAEPEGDEVSRMAPAISRSTPMMDRGLPAEEMVLWYFWREDCPVCRQAGSWLEELQEDLPHLRARKVDLLRDPEGPALFRAMMAERGERATAVPTFIFQDRVWVGFSPTVAREIESVLRVAERGASPRPTPDRTVLDLGPLGDLDVGGRSMAAATALIAFVDGFNPCSLWVLSVLLAMILGTRSRSRIAAVGLTFLLVTGAIYGAFIVGLVVALEIMSHLDWIRVAVALLALAFGLINLKDFLAFRVGPSLTIPDRFKPGIYRRGRGLREDRPLWIVLTLTVGLAAGVAVVELPCTAGFPMIWTTLVSEAGVDRMAFAGLIGLYIGVYLSVEIAILVMALVTLRASRMQERHGRILKLVGGMLMIALAAVLIFDPGIMESLSGSILVVGSALVLSLVIILVERRMKPVGPSSTREVGEELRSGRDENS